ncbi:MAG: hypothetical protein JWO60_3146 [Frankiales bacterium]|nr:hypothetical protein [Frankiales bacterium]
MRRSLLSLLPLTALAAAALPLLPAAAAPTCTGGVPLEVCGGRVVAEPETSVTFHQFDTPAESLGASLRAIEARSPRFLEVRTIAEWTGNPAHKSLGGRPLYVVRVTDEAVGGYSATTTSSPLKKQTAASLSVHGLEAAGREGGLRYLEDLALATAALPGIDKPLFAGDVSFPTSRVMRETESWYAFTNPDGWAAGDVDSTSGPGFERGNEGGFDLNRDYATVGWYDRDGGTTPARGIAESEPETRGWTSLVKGFPDLVTSTDVHGELTTPNEAFADLIIPAGQWTPTRQQQVKQLGDHMIRTIERKFAEEGVVLDSVFGALPPGDGSTPRRPANVAASYDIVGYDDSGFMGDWFSQTQDSVHMDVENFLSNLAPNNAYNGAVEQTHVAAVRGILEAVVVEAMVTRDVRPTLTHRPFAYVADPNRTTSADGTLAPVVPGETQVPYDVTRTRYFEEVERTTGRAADPVTAEAVAAGTADLQRYASVVLSDMELPAGSTADRGRYVAALRAYAEGGGQLVLTDRALRLADDLGLVPASALTVDRTDAGHVDFLAPLGDHPYEKGLGQAQPDLLRGHARLPLAGQDAELRHRPRRLGGGRRHHRRHGRAAGRQQLAEHGARQPAARARPGHRLRGRPAAGDRAARPRGRHEDRHAAPLRAGRLRGHHHRRPGARQRPELRPPGGLALPVGHRLPERDPDGDRHAHRHVDRLALRHTHRHALSHAHRARRLHLVRPGAAEPGNDPGRQHRAGPPDGHAGLHRRPRRLHPALDHLPHRPLADGRPGRHRRDDRQAAVQHPAVRPAAGLPAGPLDRLDGAVHPVARRRAHRVTHLPVLRQQPAQAPGRAAREALPDRPERP